MVHLIKAASMETIFFFTKKSKGLQKLSLSHHLSKLAKLSLKAGKTLDYVTLDRKITIYMISLITRKYPYDKETYVDVT